MVSGMNAKQTFTAPFVAPAQELPPRASSGHRLEKLRGQVAVAMHSHAVRGQTPQLHPKQLLKLNNNACFGIWSKWHPLTPTGRIARTGGRLTGQLIEIQVLALSR